MAKEMPITVASREICKICYYVNTVGFVVADDIWSAVVPPEHQRGIVCLNCFTRLADTKMIQWDKGIRLFPVSLKTHLDGCGYGEKGSDLPRGRNYW